MTPIATYTERLPQVTREFALYKDRVEIHARWRVRGEYRTRVLLNTLQPTPRTLIIRNKLYKYAFTVFLIGGILFAFSVYPNVNAPWAIAGGAIAIPGLLATLLIRRRVRFLRFDPRQGERGGLDIAATGPETDRFDAFVKVLTQRIRQA